MSYTRGALVCVCTLWLGAASAQSFPSRPIRLIVPVPPGGGADFVARGYAARLSESLGQQVVVDNRGGAAGIIAMDAVAKAAPDGYTLVQTNISTVSINPFIYPKLPYDAMRDFAPVSITTLNPLVLVVHPSLPVKTVKELIAYAKSKPGEVSYASLGSGSIQHLAGHVFSKDAGIQTVHVPYKGAAPATVDLLARQVHMAFSGVGTVAGHVTAGRLRAIAVTGKRVDVFPNVPTLQEAGGPDVRMWLWNGILAPARTPAPVIARLNADIVKAARSPELIAMMATQGTSPTSNTPEEFARFIREEQARFARIVKDSGARAD
jgi:tripartite-type tricarboxylate transporter receptor subunit TctC